MSVQERASCGVWLTIPAAVHLLLNIRVPVPLENEERRRKAQEKPSDLVSFWEAAEPGRGCYPGRAGLGGACTVLNKSHC